MATDSAVPLTTKGLSRPERKQLAHDLGLMGLSRRECIEQLLHKELLIRRLKARVDELEAAMQNDPLVSSQEVAQLDRTRFGGA